MIETLLIFAIIFLGITLTLNWYGYRINGIDRNIFVAVNMVNVCSLALNFVMLELIV